MYSTGEIRECIVQEKSESVEHRGNQRVYSTGEIRECIAQGKSESV